MNPTANEYQSILISSSSCKADLQILLDASEDYMLRRTDAEVIVAEVTKAVSQWKTLATKLGIHKREFAIFENRLDKFTVY